MCIRDRGEGDGIQRVGADARIAQSRIDHRDDVLLVGAGGELGDDAAVFDVDGLRRDDVRQELSLIHTSRRPRYGGSP